MVEVVVLNRLDNPLLAFEIINKGMALIDEDQDERLAYECKVLARYHDWRYFMKRHMESEGFKTAFDRGLDED